VRDSQGRPCRGAAERLRAALVILAEGHAQVVRQSERAWASITFEGTRHTVELSFSGSTACEAAERLIAALPDHEFALPGQLVADATVTTVDHRIHPEPRMTITCELLLLKDR
jgi:hypothetical protein